MRTESGDTTPARTALGSPLIVAGGGEALAEQGAGPGDDGDQADVPIERVGGCSRAKCGDDVEHAFALQPRFVEDAGPVGWITVDGEDEDGDVWPDAVSVGVRCEDCDQVSTPPAGRAACWQSTPTSAPA